MNLRLVDRSDAPVTLVGLRESGVMRGGNMNLRELSGAFPHSEPLASFCECRNAACYSVISMSAAEFDVMEAHRAGWLLIEAHEPSVPWPMSEIGDPGSVNTGVLVVGGWVQKRTGGGEAA